MHCESRSPLFFFSREKSTFSQDAFVMVISSDVLQTVYIHLERNKHTLQSPKISSLIISDKSISDDLLGSESLKWRTGGGQASYVNICVCLYEWTSRLRHLVSESFARLAWRKAARSLISNTQSLTISANMEGHSLWRASPFRLVSDALRTNSWRYCSIMVARSDDSTVPSCEENNRIVQDGLSCFTLKWGAVEGQSQGEKAKLLKIKIIVSAVWKNYECRKY